FVLTASRSALREAPFEGYLSQGPMAFHASDHLPGDHRASNHLTFRLPFARRRAAFGPRLMLRNTIPQHAGFRFRSGTDEPTAPLKPRAWRGTQRFLDSLGHRGSVAYGYSALHGCDSWDGVRME